MPADSDPAAHPLRDAFIAQLDPSLRAPVSARWSQHGARLLQTLHAVYADHPHYPRVLPQLLAAAAAAANARPPALQRLDAERWRDPRWFLGADMIGYSTYVDRFADTLPGVARRVPYLQALGVRYLHLLPFQLARHGDSDGGFAVRDYDAVDPALGTLDDLHALTTRLRAARISLCADFVLNHTADDHPWAQAARAGDPRYRDYYLIYPDRVQPDRHERSLGQVFPQTAPGNFSHVDGVGWVWTTFYPFQWDLNWANPRVFADMALTLLRMANRGIEAFRLDSTAYLWKRAGSDSMNQPEAHAILQALHALVGIVAPGVLLKAEAIVPTHELPPYFGDGDAAGRECHLAYHSTLMAAAWAALAERRGDILRHVVERTPQLPPGCAWISYVRCHDDIGWGVLAAEAAGDGNRPGFDLGRIATWYAGEAPGSYARGRRFQSDDGAPVHGSNGMASALAGIQAALQSGDAQALALAERRLLLLYGIAFAAAGLPLIYMGDELALGNDEHYARDPRHGHEDRWLHRPRMDWRAADNVPNADNVSGRIHAAMRRMIAARAATPALAADVPMRALAFSDPALFGIARGDDFIALFNLGAQALTIERIPGTTATRWRDCLQARIIELPLTVQPAAMHWLQPL